MAFEFLSPRGIAIVAASFALCGCAGMGGPVRSAHVPEPGYVCNVGTAFEWGAWASATLDAEGRQRSARWDWKGDSGAPLLRFWGAGSVEGPAPLSAADGYGSVQWAVPFKGNHPPRLRLELRSAPESRYWFGSGFVGSYERTGDHGLMAGWGDLTAFARGSPRLVAIVRDMRGQAVQRAEFDSAIFARGEAAVAAALAEMAAMTADFRHRCAPADINESDTILV